MEMLVRQKTGGKKKTGAAVNATCPGLFPFSIGFPALPYYLVVQPTA